MCWKKSSQQNVPAMVAENNFKLQIRVRRKQYFENWQTIQGFPVTEKSINFKMKINVGH